MKGVASIPAELMSNLLKSILVFMEKTGMSIAEIEQTFQICTRSMKSRPARGAGRSLPPLGIGCDTVAGAVLRAWYRESRYVDQRANPIPLPLRKGKVTLAALIRSQDEAADPASLSSEMLSTGLLRKDSRGRFLPTTNAATIGQMHPLAIDHVAKTVMRLVETVNRNMRSSGAKPSLIERYAHVPDLNAREAKAFASFTRQQGAACLEAIEDWLEARRIGRKAAGNRFPPSLSAGMHIFAYLGERSTNGDRTNAKRRKSAIPSRAARA